MIKKEQSCLLSRHQQTEKGHDCSDFSRKPVFFYAQRINPSTSTFSIPLNRENISIPGFIPA
jgi:hypothetical protein